MRVLIPARGFPDIDLSVLQFATTKKVATDLEGLLHVVNSELPDDNGGRFRYAFRPDGTLIRSFHQIIPE